MNNIIEVKNLILDYELDEGKNTRAISDISFSIEEGSFISIVGRNGSGKSTLAKCLNGLLLPTSGDVIVNGYNTKDEEDTWNVRETCGMVFQNPDNQLVSSIVEDDVAFGPENIGLDPIEIRKRVDDSLKAVNMYEFRNRPPHLLSGGQKQRIAIAGVIAMKPKVIVFDEPTAMLDPKGRKEILDIIDELNSEGITVILITHFMEEAIRSDRLILMEEGKIVMDGSPRKIFKDVKKIQNTGIELPLMIELAIKLRKEGIEIPSDILFKDEMVKYLCQLK